MTQENPNPASASPAPPSAGTTAPSTLNSQPSTTPPDTRLIERWLPIAEIGIESLRERTPMTPFPAPNCLHVWRARRPLVASRAAILASPLPADADHEKFNHVPGIHGDPIAPKVRIARLGSRQRLAESGGPAGKGRYCRLTRENAKGRILTALTKGGLSNAQIREITQMTRHQAWWIMKQLESEGVVETTGHERSGLWRLKGMLRPGPARLPAR